MDETVALFPPFHTEFGRNTRVGRNVFITMGCTFQDHGGLRIGDGALVGHGVMIATLNHPMDPARRADMVPGPVTIGKGAWIGANATILPGVTIGDDAVVAGSPARQIRTVAEIVARDADDADARG